MALDRRWRGKLAAKFASERRLGTELTVQLPLERRFGTHLTVKLALEWRSWAPLNVKFAKKAIWRKASFYLGKTMIFEVLGDPESSIVALRRLQWLRRSAVRRRFCRAWPLEAPLASRDAEAWGTLDAETGFRVFRTPRRSEVSCRFFCIDIYTSRVPRG